MVGLVMVGPHPSGLCHPGIRGEVECREDAASAEASRREDLHRLLSRSRFGLVGHLPVCQHY